MDAADNTGKAETPKQAPGTNHGWLGQVDLVQVAADGHGQASLIAAAKAAASVASS